MDNREEQSSAAGLEDSLLESFIRERDQAAYARVYELVRPRLLKLLNSQFPGLANIHEDVVQDAFLKLYQLPEVLWKPRNGQAPRAFSLLATAVCWRCHDFLRRKQRFGETSCEAVESAGRERDFDPHEVRTNFQTRWPSLEEMVKALRETGVAAADEDQTLLWDLASSENWKQNEDRREKLDYERLSESRGQSVDALYQRMSRLSRRAKRRFGALGVFVDVASKTVARMGKLAGNLFISRPARVGVACMVALVILLWELPKTPFFGFSR